MSLRKLVCGLAICSSAFGDWSIEDDCYKVPMRGMTGVTVSLMFRIGNDVPMTKIEVPCARGTPHKISILDMNSNRKFDENDEILYSTGKQIRYNGKDRTEEAERDFYRIYDLADACFGIAEERRYSGRWTPANS